MVETPRLSATRRQTTLPADDAEGDADEQADGPEGGGLPRDRGAYLSAVEAERFEQGEVAASSSDRGDEGVADGDERETGEERGEGCREPVDVMEAVDFDGKGGRYG